MDQEFEARIKRAISVLHFKYLLGACKEAKAVLPKTDLNNLNLFDLIISIHSFPCKYGFVNFILLI